MDGPTFLGMPVRTSGVLREDEAIFVKSDGTFQRFLWTANALAEQEVELEQLRARVAELERQIADEPEVVRCAGGCGEVVEEAGERCTTCEEIAKDEAAGDDEYHRTREDEP